LGFDFLWPFLRRLTQFRYKRTPEKDAPEHAISLRDCPLRTKTSGETILPVVVSARLHADAADEIPSFRQPQSLVFQSGRFRRRAGHLGQNQNSKIHRRFFSTPPSFCPTFCPCPSEIPQLFSCEYSARTYFIKNS